MTIGILLFPGCSKEENDKTVLLNSVADFEVSEAQINVWETVKFKDVSENEPVEWEWLFEGGEPEVSVEAGTYAVKLTVRNEKGENLKEGELYRGK